MNVFADNIWLRGQNAGSHHGLLSIPGVNKLETVEGAGVLGIKNCCRVVMSNKQTPPFDEKSAKLICFYIWSGTGDATMLQTIVMKFCGRQSFFRM